MRATVLPNEVAFSRAASSGLALFLRARPAPKMVLFPDRNDVPAKALTSPRARDDGTTASVVRVGRATDVLH